MISSYHPSLNRTVSCSSDEEDCRQTDDFFVKTDLYRLNWMVSKNFCKILIIFFFICLGEALCYQWKWLSNVNRAFPVFNSEADVLFIAWGQATPLRL